MMSIVWILLTLAGLGITFFGSRKAIRHATALTHGTSIPPFLIGVTLVAIGTDLPEMANSVMSSLSGHGDMNVGDSVGSVMTQITLALGLLGVLGGRSIEIRPARFVPVGICTVIALGIGALLVADGDLTRSDALLLLATWIVLTAVLWRLSPTHHVVPTEAPEHHKALHAGLALLFLGLVGVGAGMAVKGITELSMLLGVPEYLISFFGTSIGTSLPELAVDLTAIYSGEQDLAIGDIIGSCLVDATLSLGIGPLIAPTAVTAALATRGAIVAIGAITLATAVLAIRRRHDRWSGVFLLLVYAASYVAVLAV